ncbi:MAG: mechanosensitive ion channel family protein [Nanoarchaeota archaeon]
MVFEFLGDLQTMIGQEYLTFIIILIAAIIGSKIVQFAVIRTLSKLTGKTKTDIDDKIIAAVRKPILISITLFGFQMGLGILSIFSSYQQLISDSFYIIYILLIALVVSRIVRIFVGKGLHVKTGVQNTPNILNKVIILIIYIVALFVIMGRFGADLTGAIAALGVGGIAIGLALQDTLSNFFAGIHIVSDRPINVGDYIELDANTKGFVEEIGWRSTRIRTMGNVSIIVPNGKLADSTIINNTLPSKPTSVIIKCGVAYTEDLYKVEKVTLEVANEMQKTVDGAVKDHEPMVRFNNFGDSNIDFSVILRVEEFTKKYLITHEFIKALKKRFDKEKIEISWPVRKIVKGK